LNLFLYGERALLRGRLQRRWGSVSDCVLDGFENDRWEN
jgi:hypothetical protein